MSATTVTVLSVPCHALGVNQVGGSFQRHRKHKEQVMRDAGLLWAEAGRPTYQRAVVDIVIVVGKSGRYDPQNYHGAGTVKWVCDALTQCGCWADDRPLWLVIRETTVEYRRGQWAVELRIGEQA